MNEVNKNTCPAITVIICMYKGEDTVSRMIDCVLNQTFRDFELILVDDGSPDRCGEIADEYAQKDERVRVLHKPNGGLADARNKALEIATGEYTIQFDQDDWVELNCLEEMYAEAKKQDVDMIICDYYYNLDTKQTYKDQKPSALDHWSVLGDIVGGKLFGFCWNKLIKLDAYRRFDVQFPLEIYGCEDQYGMCKLLKNEITIGYLPHAYCHYVAVYGSLSRHYDEKTYENDLLIRKMFVELLKGTPYQDLAFENKTHYMFGRAFMFGYQWFSSKRFVQEFGEYERLILSAPLEKIYHICYWLSFRGFYGFSRRLFGFLFSINQGLKRILVTKS